MNKKVTLLELVADKIIYSVLIAVYYWCWARNDWHDYYMVIQNGVAIFTVIYFFFRSSRMRKYKKECIDEMAENNLKRCDAICFKIIVLALIVIAFAAAILRMISSTEVIGYCLVGLLIIISVVRTILFGLMDKKGL